jgi:ATP-binding cassette subfamily B protein
MQLGSLIAFGAYLGMATGPVQSLLGLYMAWQRLRVSLGRVSYLRQQPLPQASVAGLAPPEDLKGEVRLEQLDFGYREGPPVFNNVSLSIPAGARVGIHGRSGIGKSTLLDLLQLHLRPQRGKIRIDGHDIGEFNPVLWRSRIAVVPQDPVIFRGTLIDNVRYSVPGASDQDVEQACLRAGLWPLLEKLPGGLASLVSERGTSLSGGERQRIALARALLQDPILLLLDEPTSAVDVDTELALVREIERLFSGITQLIVSHRPSALAGVDLLLTIEAGNIVVETAPTGGARYAC